MNIDEILNELDRLFAVHEIEAVEEFLCDNIKKAIAENNISIQVTLLNELIGYYRDLTFYDKSIQTCQQVMELLNSSDLVGSIAYATTLQNIANSLRAAGKLEASMKFYQQVFDVYENQLEINDMRYASLSNNMSLLYQEMADYENAYICLEKALEIVSQYDDVIKIATTYTNMANSLIKLNKCDKAIIHIEKAFEIFELDEEKDFHYSAALCAMAEIKYILKHYDEAIFYYQEAMKELEFHVGKTENYYIIERNCNAVYEQLGRTHTPNKPYKNVMALCEDFYKAYGIPMIEEKFGPWATSIAVGLVGCGSDCFGYDDNISLDHDCGPGFCIWLSDDVYDEIAEKLQEEYDALPTIYMGIRRKTSERASKRVGVFRIRKFYSDLLGVIPTKEQDWLSVEDWQLAAATNGKIFRDDLGEFTKIRNDLLQYYPKNVYVKKVAQQAALMAQTGQYNYQRMLKRNDLVTANIILSDFEQHTMKMSFLLNRVYCPFYKWQYKALQSLNILPELPLLIAKLQANHITSPENIVIIENIAQLVVSQLKKAKLTTIEDKYLDSHTDEILASIK